MKTIFFDFFCPSYILFPIGIAALVVGLYFALKKAPDRVKRLGVLLIMLLNVMQHFLKSSLYPHLLGNGFTYVNTAYNVCAFLILVSPLALFFGSRPFKDFVFSTGIIAGVLTMIYPVWFLGKEVLLAEVARFYICHGLLLLSSLLVYLLGIRQVERKSWRRYGVYFLLMLAAVYLNTVFCIYLGLVPGSGPDTLHETMVRIDQFWMMGPNNGFEWLARLLDPITPDVLFHGDEFVPILWYAVPLYLSFSLISLAVFSFFEWLQKRKEGRR